MITSKEEGGELFFWLSHFFTAATPLFPHGKKQSLRDRKGGEKGKSQEEEEGGERGGSTDKQQLVSFPPLFCFLPGSPGVSFPPFLRFPPTVSPPSSH